MYHCNCNKNNSKCDENIQQSQHYTSNQKTVKIGDIAPNFYAETTLGPCSISDYKGKWCILFSHPNDFTPVCTTEMISFANFHEEFCKRNCYLIGMSTDSLNSHLAWINDIYEKTNIMIKFPIISDHNLKVSKLYGMIEENNENTDLVRNVYIIGPDQKIKSILSYPKTTGRYIPEILRIIDALQTTDATNNYTGANWMPTMPTIQKPPHTFDGLLEINEKNMYLNNCFSWYLCYKNK